MHQSQLHIKIFGNVQGVFFRYHTVKLARKLNVFGWVKNTNDGAVEIMAEGERDKLEKLLEWCRQGPKFARVDKVEYQWSDWQGGMSSFKIVYD